MFYLFVENPRIMEVLIFGLVALVATAGLIFHWLFGGFSGDDSKEGLSVGTMAFLLAWSTVGLVMAFADKPNGFVMDLSISFIIAFLGWLAVDAVIWIVRRASDKKHGHELVHQH